MWPTSRPRRGAEIIGSRSLPDDPEIWPRYHPQKTKAMRIGILSLMGVSCKLTIPNSDGNPFGTCTSPGLSPLAANRQTIRRLNIHGKDASFSVISTGPSRGRTDMSESVALWHLWPRRFLSQIAPLIRQHKKAMVRLQSRPSGFAVLGAEDWTRRHLFWDLWCAAFGLIGTLIIG